MPAKNTSAFIEECLQSIINQSFKCWELIVVNDHSADNTLQIIKNFVKKDNRIIALNNNGNGIIDALKTGYKKSRGNFITRMDSDDIMHKDKLEIMQNQLKNFGKGNIAIGLVKYFPDVNLGNGYLKYEKWLNNLTLKGNNFNEIYKECVIPSPSWMVFREDFKKAGEFNSTSYPEDYDLTFRFYQAGLKCIPMREILHFWRDYPTRTSRTSINYAYNSFIDLKVDYFLKLNYKKYKKLILWGAGKKGKTIAKKLIDYKINFTWICDNPKKIEKEIYDIKLKDFRKIKIDENTQSIIAVANEKAQKEIILFLSKKNMQAMENYFFFC